MYLANSLTSPPYISLSVQYRPGVVRERLGGIKVHKSVGLDGVHPRVLREWAEVSARPLSVISDSSWRTAECLKTGGEPVSLQPSKRARREDSGSYWSLTSIPGKVMEQLPGRNSLCGTLSFAPCSLQERSAQFLNERPSQVFLQAQTTAAKRNDVCCLWHNSMEMDLVGFVFHEVMQPF